MKRKGKNRKQNPKTKKCNVQIKEDSPIPKDIDAEGSQADATENSDEKNKEQAQNSRSEKKNKSQIRTLRVSWLHKSKNDKRYRKVQKPLGGVQRLKLDESQSFSANDIKQMAIKAFDSTVEKFTFEDRFDISLGHFDGHVITDFTLYDDTICDIWSYCSAQRVPLYQLNLFILTTLKNEEDCELVFGVLPPVKTSSKLIRTKRKRKKRKDDVQVYYNYTRCSKYSNELICIECRKTDLHIYVREENFGDAPPIEQFEPLDYGYPISRIEKCNNIFLQISTQENGLKTFRFPSAIQLSTNAHSIIHDLDELQGVCEGTYGIGFVINCTDMCRPVFNWFKDGQLFRKSEYLYWLNNVESDGQKHVWSCIVKCRDSEIKSKEVTISC